MIHGLIVINKKTNYTSHDVVNRVRRVFKTKKVGHFGTLDPMAEGILLIGIGNVTKYFNFFVKKKKTYTGEIKFGFSTDTYDRLGVASSEKCEINLLDVDLEKVKKQFTGNIQQIPPKYSAKKKDGKPLYKYARENIDVTIKACSVTIYNLKLTALNQTTLAFETQTSEGTYIRSLAHDIGQFLGCGAHLNTLIRSQVGDFNLDQAIDFDDLKIENAEKLLQKTIPIEKLLPDFPKVIVHSHAEQIVLNGGFIIKDHIEQVLDYNPEVSHFRLFSDQGSLLAIARFEKGGFKPFMVFNN